MRSLIPVGYAQRVAMSRLDGLVRNALRMRPDRVIVGECRGEEALDMLQAMKDEVAMESRASARVSAASARVKQKVDLFSKQKS